jgi:hypothetical protein
LAREAKPASATASRGGWPEEVFVSLQTGQPQRPIGHAARTRVVRDELGLGLLDLDELPELGGFGRLALANDFSVGLKQAEYLSG